MSRSGQALVEFAATIGFLLFFLVFSFYAFLTCCDYMTVQQMTREALRMATVETGANRSEAEGRVGISGKLLAYEAPDVTIRQVVVSGSPIKNQVGVKKLYGSTIYVTVKVTKKDNIPDIIGFLGFMADVPGAFPPETLEYTLHMRPESEVMPD